MAILASLLERFRDPFLKQNTNSIWKKVAFFALFWSNIPIQSGEKWAQIVHFGPVAPELFSAVCILKTPCKRGVFSGVRATARVIYSDSEDHEPEARSHLCRYSARGLRRIFLWWGVLGGSIGFTTETQVVSGVTWSNGE